MSLNTEFRPSPKPAPPISRLSSFGIEAEHKGTPNPFDSFSFAEVVTTFSLIEKSDSFSLIDATSNSFPGVDLEKFISTARNRTLISTLRRRTFVSPTVTRNQTGVDRVVTFQSKKREDD